MTAQIIQFPARAAQHAAGDPFEAYCRYLDARRSMRDLPRFSRESVDQLRVSHGLAAEEAERLVREEQQYRPLEG